MENQEGKEIEKTKEDPFEVFMNKSVVKISPIFRAVVFLGIILLALDYVASVSDSSLASLTLSDLGGALIGIVIVYFSGKNLIRFTYTDEEVERSNIFWAWLLLLAVCITVIAIALVLAAD